MTAASALVSALPKRRNNKASLASVANIVMIRYSDYLRDRAAKYHLLAEAATEPAAKQEFLELAAACEEVASNIDDRRASG
jgi:hypothetical protein